MNRDVDMTDYDDEARRLWQRLNLTDPAKPRGLWNPVDSIYRDPNTGGTIYVGGIQIAQDLPSLRKMNITHIVNCTHGPSAIPCFHENVDNGPKYYVYPIARWFDHVRESDPITAVRFTEQLWKFIDGALAKGESVLVHCLAGAHRAGTTGVSCLIHYGDMDAAPAIALAKKLRPVIDPISRLSVFLETLRAGELLVRNQQ